jgi:SagB-type dehydrogenase family enzyme
VRPVDYHDATKHHFHRFSRSLGYLDWATQPDPFRRYHGAPLIELPRTASHPSSAYQALYAASVAPVPINIPSIGTLLRCSMGLSAWKQYGTSRWALRVNPSSGNLHPTEAYVVWRGHVSHYAPREHSLEQRCVAGDGLATELDSVMLVGLTSIHWREAWKYGERAFRYCQHDAGHAIAALRLAAAMLGWRFELLAGWSHGDIAALLGLDRESDFEGVEREEPECLALVTAGAQDWNRRDPDRIVDAARRGRWHGLANRLSRSHVEWPAIDAIAHATRFERETAPVVPDELAPRPPDPDPHAPSPSRTLARSHADVVAAAPPRPPDTAAVTAASVFLRRRSALAFDPRGVLRRESFLAMLGRLQPGAPPWDAIDWQPQVHLALFVHRVMDVVPGIYAYVRDAAALADLRSAMRAEFLWEQTDDALYLLAPVDAKHTANRLSCDQEIAADGFFSLGMLARFEQPLRDRGEWFYRRLFWECGMVGQVLYLEAEVAGARATGIGCFYDDPVHEVLGLTGHTWQSLYHFSMGLAVEDGRLTTEPGYDWESGTGER